MTEPYPPLPTAAKPTASVAADASRAAAIAAFNRDDAAAAASAIAELARVAPGSVETLRLQALLAARRGDHGAAIRWLQEALRAHPDHRPLLINLAENLTAIAAFAPAAAIRARLTTLFPADADGWLERGRAHHSDSDMDAACSAFRRSLELDPTRDAARVLLAHALLACGHAAQAEQALRDALRRAPDNAQAWFGLVCAVGARLDDAELATLRALHAGMAVASEQRVFAGFALARALEATGAPAAAFAALTAANADRRGQLRWDAARFSRHVDTIATTFAAPLAQADDSALGAGAIFIVGMPRSGSTLVEQILSAHAGVAAGGERVDLAAVIAAESRRRGSALASWAPLASAADWQRLGGDYLRRAQAWQRSAASASDSHFTDKALLNWRFVGAAAAMLPAARFLICRRDPLATCLSCFRHLFGQEHAYTCDLGELAVFWHDQHRLTSQWLRQLPGRTHLFEHERLLAETEPSIRGLLDFCALPFDPACLRFHENPRAVRTASVTQVRRPLQHAASHTAAYGALLDPLRRRLAAAHAGSD